MSTPFPNPQYGIASLKPGMPGVVKAYIGYCIIAALFLSCYLLMGIGLMVFAEPLAEADQQVKDPMFFMLLGGCTTASFAPFVLLNLCGLCFHKGKGGYVMGMIVLITGLLYCMPLAAVLLVFWFQQPTKIYFGFTPRWPPGAEVGQQALNRFESQT